MVRISATAGEDIRTLLQHTLANFGEFALERYQALLLAAIQDIAADPERPGSIARPEFGLAVRSYHLRFSRDRAQVRGEIVRRPRHLLLYRAQLPTLIGIGRVLHDSMELERHLPDSFGDS